MGLFGKKKRAPHEDQTLSLYYASDVHGSDQCWRKFLGAGRFYEVQALIMGGDLTGKAIVPIERNGSGRSPPPFSVRPGAATRSVSSTNSSTQSASTACTPGSRRPARSPRTPGTSRHSRDLFDR